MKSRGYRVGENGNGNGGGDPQDDPESDPPEGDAVANFGALAGVGFGLAYMILMLRYSR